MRRQLLGYCLAVSVWIVTACGPTAAAKGIDAPSHLRTEALSATEVMLSWDPMDDITAIHVERRDGLEAPFVEVGVTGGEASSHLNTGLTTGATYVWRLRACRGDQCSDYSQFISLVVTAP
jgi:hypothetical protein